MGYCKASYIPSFGTLERCRGTLRLMNLQVLLNVTHTIAAPGIIKNGTTALSSPDIIRAMLIQVTSTSRAQSANITVLLDVGAAMTSMFVLGSEALQDTVIGSCCGQYENALKDFSRNPGTPIRHKSITYYPKKNLNSQC